MRSTMITHNEIWMIRNMNRMLHPTNLPPCYRRHASAGGTVSRQHVSWARNCMVQEIHEQKSQHCDQEQSGCLKRKGG